MGRWGCWHHRWVIASYWDAVVCYTGWNAACIRESNRKASRTLIKNPSLSSIWYVMSPKGRDRHSGSWFFCEGETLDDTTKVYKSDIIFWSMAKDFLNLCTWRCCVLQEPHPQFTSTKQTYRTCDGGFKDGHYPQYLLAICPIFFRPVLKGARLPKGIAPPNLPTGTENHFPSIDFHIMFFLVSSQ